MDDSSIPLLDLFDSNDKEMHEIAHKKALEVSLDDDTKNDKEEEDEYEEYKTIDFWDIVKYAAVFIGGGFVIHKLLSVKKEDPANTNNQMMMTMMFLIYQSNMHLMSAINNNKPIVSTSPPSPAAAIDETKALSTDNKDWIKFFEDNKGQILNRDELMKLDELGVKENWRVERDLKGKVLNVYKVSEYLR